LKGGALRMALMISLGGSGGWALAQGDPVLGRTLAEDERCIECHGADGKGWVHASASAAESKFPKLAGQLQAYLLKQFDDFRQGLRKDDQMAMMARSVDPEDARHIAAFFASLPGMGGEGGTASPAGKRLYEQGDPARGIVACASCHGPTGKGRPGDALTPVLGGQSWRYLEKQLRDWRSGHRRNGRPEALMNVVTKSLSDAEIEALATHMAGL